MLLLAPCPGFTCEACYKVCPPLSSLSQLSSPIGSWPGLNCSTPIFTDHLLLSSLQLFFNCRWSNSLTMWYLCCLDHLLLTCYALKSNDGTALSRKIANNDFIIFVYIISYYAGGFTGCARPFCARTYALTSFNLWQTERWTGNHTTAN